MTDPRHEGFHVEKDFMIAVMDLARRNGWCVFHDWDPLQNTPGFPDLVMAKNGRVIFTELKIKGRDLTDNQVRWMKNLYTDHIGPTHQAYVWEPEDWDEIEQKLTS